ncbi:response regulator receiver and SARP domain protein [Clostridium putrefaciens]|uniref:Response regulator receiver and SARP domain protein n=1 Tax=Clostridium putrefaciens TaxID=99675 RepID=A0A381J4Y4_9CLOT|nr:winged helix-turn-helix domain-containing protein [Clostridium putrefaciens]SUY46086.1 response regulator receiver and SARP domain protein [Clostridium putrefaciens]
MDNENLTLKSDLEIYTFGDFDVKYKGISIVYKFNNSPQIFNLFMFFISYRHRILSAEFIEENLWEDKEYQDSKSVIKGQIFRLRKLIKEASLEECNGELEKYIEIEFKSGGYSLNLKGDYFIDNEEFQKKIKIIKRAEELEIVDIEGDLFKQLQMTVNYDGEELYSGSLGDFSKENLYLADFQKGDSKEIDINVYLQGEETDNRYQDKYIKSQWIFTANVDGNQKMDKAKGNNIWGLPKTGGVSLITLCVAGVALMLVGVEKLLTNKERTDKTNF